MGGFNYEKNDTEELNVIFKELLSIKNDLSSLESKYNSLLNSLDAVWEGKRKDSVKEKMDTLLWASIDASLISLIQTVNNSKNNYDYASHFLSKQAQGGEYIK